MSSALLQGSVLGVVLSGGASRRMGRAKENLPFGSLTLIQLATRKLRSVCSEVVISKKEACGSEPSFVLEDFPYLQGPLAGIVTALEKTAGEGILCVPVDTPYLTVESLLGILEQREEADVVLLKREEMVPTIAFYRRTALNELWNMGRCGEFSLKRILRKGRLALRFLDASWLRQFGEPQQLLFNINTPEAYRLALSQIRTE